VASEMRAKNELRANILKALANLTRVCIIEKLRDGPHSVNELSNKIGESSSITSRHLGVRRSSIQWRPTEFRTSSAQLMK